VAEGDGVELEPVTGITTKGVSVIEGIGVLIKLNSEGFVGVKNNAANASCVNTRSTGVGVKV
jgi:hypothetical protein